MYILGAHLMHLRNWIHFRLLTDVRAGFTDNLEIIKPKYDNLYTNLSQPIRQTEISANEALGDKGSLRSNAAIQNVNWRNGRIERIWVFAPVRRSYREPRVTKYTLMIELKSMGKYVLENVRWFPKLHSVFLMCARSAWLKFQIQKYYANSCRGTFNILAFSWKLQCQ